MTAVMVLCSLCACQLGSLECKSGTIGRDISQAFDTNPQFLTDLDISFDRVNWTDAKLDCSNLVTAATVEFKGMYCYETLKLLTGPGCENVPIICDQYEPELTATTTTKNGTRIPHLWPLWPIWISPLNNRYVLLYIYCIWRVVNTIAF
jgi:hypothetical protein